jgi:hypothetical protein
MKIRKSAIPKRAWTAMESRESRRAAAILLLFLARTGRRKAKAHARDRKEEEKGGRLATRNLPATTLEPARAKAAMIWAFPRASRKLAMQGLRA